MQTSDGVSLERGLQASTDALSQAISELPEGVWQREVLNRLRQVEPHLRSLQVQHPALGLLSGYEAFLIIGAHTMRHVAQIHELASTEGVTVAQ